MDHIAPISGHTARRIGIAAVLAVIGIAPASADPQALLVARESVNYLYYFGGFAISSDEGEDGAPAPVPGGLWEGTPLTAFNPRTLSIAGSDYHVIQYLFWNGYLAESWKQTQTFGFGQIGKDAVLTSSGKADIEQTSEVCWQTCSLATELHRSTNTQALEFTLTEGSDYRLSGLTAGGQYVDVLLWSDAGQRWNAVIAGGLVTKDVAFDLSGRFDAGRWMIRPSPYTFSGGVGDVHNSWSYELQLLNAQAVGMVPEPAAGVLLVAGMFVMGLWLRGRHMPTKGTVRLPGGSAPAEG